MSLLLVLILASVVGDWSPTTLASIFVAGIAALSAYASQRAAARASTLNTSTTSRVDMEREAYERARAFDTETIARQDREIAELRTMERDLRSELVTVRAENASQRGEIRALKLRVKNLERGDTR